MALRTAPAPALLAVVGQVETIGSQASVTGQAFERVAPPPGPGIRTSTSPLPASGGTVTIRSVPLPLDATPSTRGTWPLGEGCARVNQTSLPVAANPVPATVSCSPSQLAEVIRGFVTLRTP